MKRFTTRRGKRSILSRNIPCSLDDLECHYHSLSSFPLSLTQKQKNVKKMYKIKIQIPAWYLHKMVAQHTLCTCEEKQVFVHFVEKYFKFYDFVDVNECLKQIKLPGAVYM